MTGALDSDEFQSTARKMLSSEAMVSGALAAAGVDPWSMTMTVADFQVLAARCMFDATDEQVTAFAEDAVAYAAAAAAKKDDSDTDSERDGDSDSESASMVAASVAVNFKSIGGHVLEMRAAAFVLVESSASVFRNVTRVVQTLGDISDIVHRVTALMGKAN
jgi:hypothetical protein